MVIDVTALVYAIPIVASLIVVLGMVVRAVASRGPNGFKGPSRRRNRSFVPGIIMGIGGLLVAGVMFARADADMRRFATDPTCSAGFVASATLGGSCRVVDGYIEDFYWTSGRGAHRRLVVRLADGSQQAVNYGTNRRGNLWNGVMRRGDRSATAQLFTAASSRCKRRRDRRRRGRCRSTDSSCGHSRGFSRASSAFFRPSVSRSAEPERRRALKASRGRRRRA